MDEDPAASAAVSLDYIKRRWLGGCMGGISNAVRDMQGSFGGLMMLADPCRGSRLQPGFAALLIQPRCSNIISCERIEQMPSKPNETQLRMAELLKQSPDGMTCGQLRRELEKEGLQADEQTHLDRRYRDLPKWYRIEKSRVKEVVGGKTVSVVKYAYRGERGTVTDQGQVSQKVRAEVIHAAHGRCQMCGRTVQMHGISLVVDHKKPRDWGGTNDRENLWAICEECNGGKKSYFSSLNVDAEFMKKVTADESVHVRIGETLKAVGIGKRTPPEILDVVADQEDWHKRLRELRYPVIGWEIDTVPYKTPSGRKKVDYVLKKYKPWPTDPTAKIRQFEQDRQRRNKGEQD